jgi:hypothetical protein
MLNAKTIIRALTFVAFNVIVALGLLEGLLLLLLHTPGVTGATPRPVRRLVQQVYRHFNRMLIQFDPNCSRYDAQLTYLLRAGECTFSNLEFSTRIYANPLGVRDDDEALVAPEVIVLGDSHVMGWGIEQDETLVRAFARKTRLKTLDAGVSSYGTVREMRMLDRLDTTRLKYLIVQYADNDLPENRSFREHDGFIPITSEEQYRKIVEYYEAQRSYYPGKYVYRLFMKVLRLEPPEPDQLTMGEASPAEEAELFLNVLAHGTQTTSLDNVQVIVFEINEQITPPRPFIAALDQARPSTNYPPWIQRLIAVDVAPKLTTADFFVLDDHMRPSGHRKVGEALAAVVPR